MKLAAKLAIGTAALCLPLAAFAATQHTDRENEAASLAHAPKPIISKQQARMKALTVAKGTVVDNEYEKENGAWRWSVEVRQNGKIHEIGVDAMTGKIVENSWETSVNAD